MGRRSAVTALIAVVGGLLALVSPAAAQTGYPPGACTATVSSASLASFPPGNTLNITLAPVCAFTPGTPVTVTVNGQPVGTKTANADGVVTVSVTIVDTTTLSVDDPVIVPAICGNNTVVARGTSAAANNAQVTHTVTFGVTCPTPAAAAATPARVAFTGANILRASAVALALLIGGSLLVVGTRKRRQQSSVAAR